VSSTEPVKNGCEVIYEMFSWLERRTRIARSRAQTPFKSRPPQASTRNCPNCVHNCDDHSLFEYKCSF